MEIEVAIYEGPWDYTTKMAAVDRQKDTFIATDIGDWSNYPGIDHTYFPVVLTQPLGVGTLFKIPNYKTTLMVSEEHRIKELVKEGETLFKHYVKLDLWEGEPWPYMYRPYSDEYVHPSLIRKGNKIEVVKWR